MTLVEILIVITVLIMMVMGVIMAMNPAASMNKARDTQRKKDLDRIKIAFEDYFNDRNCYPNQALVTAMTTLSNCKSKIFSPWLSEWPCDPNGLPYSMAVGDDTNCPKWYKIMTNLENKSDPQIFDQGGIGAGLGVPVNYGVASGNISNDK